MYAPGSDSCVPVTAQLFGLLQALKYQQPNCAFTSVLNKSVA